jgi:hypothetical protein
MVAPRHPSPGWGASVAGLLLVLCVLLAACGPLPGFGPNDPTLPAGWNWYHDARFPYQAPVPPGWQTVAFNDWTYGEPRDCVRKAFFLPPGSHTEAEYLSPSPRVPEYISIETMVNCPETDTSKIPLKPLPDKLVVSGAPASLYGDYWSDSGFSSLRRIAFTHFGGHQYSLDFRYDAPSPTTPTERMQSDLALYMQLLQGFKYMGK